MLFKFIFLQKDIFTSQKGQIQDQTACSLQSNLGLQCPQKMSESQLQAKR